MLSHLRNNVVGYLALTVALSGTSYAAVQLRAGQVKTKHLANSAVTSKKIDNQTIAAGDLKAGLIKNGAILVGKLGDGLDEPAQRDAQTESALFTLPRDGQVYLRYFVSQTFVSCSAGTPYLGLYVDGNPVPGSFVAVAPTEPEARAAELVATVSLSKGEHGFLVGAVCPTGDMTNGLFSGPTWTALQVG